MTSNEIEPGDSLSLAYSELRTLRTISNNSSRLPDTRIAAALTTRRGLKSLVALLRSLPRDGYENVQIVAADAQDTGRASVSVDETGVLRFGVPLELARVWFSIANETIAFLGDPEARYVTGRASEELRTAVARLRRENWQPVI